MSIPTDFQDFLGLTERGFSRKKTDSGYEYMFVRSFEAAGISYHGFSTKHNGLGLLDPNATTALPRENKYMDFRAENMRPFYSSVGVDIHDTVLANAAHGVHVHRAGAVDRGRGYFRVYQRYAPTYDGLVTNENRVCLNTTHADCTGVMFLDPDKRVAGVCHAGWRGTVDGIIRNTVSAMCCEYGCDPKNILAAITPQMKQCCFQVREDVIAKIDGSYPKDIRFYAPDNEEGAYRADLEKLSTYDLFISGLQPGNVTIADDCTCCNADDFYSYRRDGKVVGVMNAFIQLI